MRRDLAQPHVVLRLARAEVPVAAGGLIGRLGTADLRVEDPRVSELHAMVSLRGRELHLLALRGPVTADGEPADDVLLSPGLRIQLASSVEVEVVSVHVPEQVLALVDPAGSIRELCARVYSWTDAGLVDAFVADAMTHVWSAADGWWRRDAGQAARSLRVGDTVGDLRVELVPVAAVGTSATDPVRAPLRIVVRTTTVHLHRPRVAAATVDGIPGRILSEVALCSGPAPWDAIAREIWPGVRDRGQLRELWDRSTRRLRERLRECGVREDLLRPDGHGNVELMRHPGDAVVDES